MRAGTKVRLGENIGEEFVVVHIEYSMAWVRPSRGCSPAGHMLVPLSRLCEIGTVLPSFLR